MTTSIRLCAPDETETLLSLMERCHAERGIELEDDARRAAVLPLLENSPYGAAYLLGPTRGPVGYVIVTFGWSVAQGGMEAWIDDIFIRPGIRGRGMATEVLLSLGRTLGAAGVRAISQRIDVSDAAAVRLFRRAGFAADERAGILTRVL